MCSGPFMIITFAHFPLKLAFMFTVFLDMSAANINAPTKILKSINLVESNPIKLQAIDVVFP